MYKKIILPTDGSGYADDEVERATKLIADDGEIVILSVIGGIISSVYMPFCTSAHIIFAHSDMVHLSPIVSIKVSGMSLHL